jgi:hypothetical protein
MKYKLTSHSPYPRSFHEEDCDMNSDDDGEGEGIGDVDGGGNSKESKIKSSSNQNPIFTAYGTDRYKSQDKQWQQRVELAPANATLP